MSSCSIKSICPVLCLPFAAPSLPYLSRFSRISAKSRYSALIRASCATFLNRDAFSRKYTNSEFAGADGIFSRLMRPRWKSCCRCRCVTSSLPTTRRMIFELERNRYRPIVSMILRLRSVSSRPKKASGTRRVLGSRVLPLLASKQVLPCGLRRFPIWFSLSYGRPLLISFNMLLLGQDLSIDISSLASVNTRKHLIFVPFQVLGRSIKVFYEGHQHRLRFLIVHFDEAVARELLFQCGCELCQLLIS